MDNTDLGLYLQEEDGALVPALAYYPKEGSKFFVVNIVLKNESGAMAELVKVDVDVQREACLELIDCPPMTIFQEHQYADFWKANACKQTRLQAMFNGGRDFVLFPDDAESIGRIKIPVLDTGPDGKEEKIVILYTIRRQGVTKKSGQLAILIQDREARDQAQVQRLINKNMPAQEEIKALQETIDHNPGNKTAKKRLIHLQNFGE